MRKIHSLNKNSESMKTISQTDWEAKNQNTSNTFINVKEQMTSYLEAFCKVV